MSMSSKIEPVSNPFQTGWTRTDWTKAALLAAGVIAYQVMVYSMIIGEPDGGLGEGLMVAPLLLVAGCVLGRTWRGRILLAALAAFGVVGFFAWRALGATPAVFYPGPYLCVYLSLLGLFGATLRTGVATSGHS